MINCSGFGWLKVLFPTPGFSQSHNIGGNLKIMQLLIYFFLMTQVHRMEHTSIDFMLNFWKSLLTLTHLKPAG